MPSRVYVSWCMTLDGALIPAEEIPARVGPAALERLRSYREPHPAITSPTPSRLVLDLEVLDRSGVPSGRIDDDPVLAGAAFDLERVERVLCVVSPTLAPEGAAVPPVLGRGAATVGEGWHLEPCAWERLGDDLVMEGEVRQAPGPVVVQKFGGSSVASADGRARAISKIRRAREDGRAPVVVVSAMGRCPDPYATDSLLALLAFAHGEVDLRERDLLMACGEIISVVVMAHALRREGIPAVALTGPQAGFRTDAAHGEALIREVDPSPLRRHLRAGRVPVVAGFQGAGPDGEITTLGRGGSDTSAVALGAALGACAVEIYTDVDGVMTVDPRVHEGARLVREMSYEELGELAVEGARVMHPRSVDLAGACDVPLVIRSTFSDDEGTRVTSGAPARPLEQQRVVTSITPLGPVAQVIVHLAGLDRDEMRSRILEALAVRSLSLDLINLCQEDLYFIVKQDRSREVSSCLEALAVPFTIREDCAKLSIVGVGMRGTPGVVARIHKTLWRAGVPVLHSTDSNITISCLIPGSDMQRAVECLHREFLEPAGA